MKVLLLFYEELSAKREEVFKVMEENYRLLKKRLGLDNLYASVSEDFLGLVKSFPELCFVYNRLGTLQEGLYRGLRKLKKDDLLIVDGGKRIKEESLWELLKEKVPSVALSEGGWGGLAYLPLREVYYFIKSLEREGGLLKAFEALKRVYGIPYASLKLA